MAVRRSFASEAPLSLIHIALLFICLASLLSTVNSRSTSHHLESGGRIDSTPGISHGQARLGLWTKFSRHFRSIIWSDLSSSDRTPTTLSRDGHGQPTLRLRTRYSEDLVLRFSYSTADELSALAEACDVLFLDVWEFGENFVDIRLSKDIVSPLLGLLPKSLQHAHTPIMQELDLAQAVYNSYPQTFSASANPHSDLLSVSAHRPKNAEETNIFFQNYQPLSVIVPWMRLLSSIFPTHVRMINVGETHQGRSIAALRIGVHPTNNDDPLAPRKSIIVAGGIHAREWIGTSSVSYVAYSFATQYGKSAFIKNLVDSFDWVFIPTVNPDGYDYTWNEDRLWRKNRQSTRLRFCSGIDLDRSYAYHWDGAATSDNPCSESFAGEEPLEAVETRTFTEWVRNETNYNNAEIVGFLDLHSYSQEVLYPYSYSCTASPPSLENLQELAMGLAKAIRLADGHYYKVISACGENALPDSDKDARRSVLPQGGGSALDWFYGEMGVRLSFQIKLRDTGSYGFLLPREHIVPSGKEVLEAVLYFGKYLRGELDLRASEKSGMPPAKTESPLRSEGAYESNEQQRSSVPLKHELNDIDEPLQQESDQHEQLELRRRRRR